MPNPRKNLTGQTFGKLTVIAPSGKNAFGNSVWMCECECGAIKDILYQHLVKGRTRSCGDCEPRGWSAYHRRKDKPK